MSTPLADRALEAKRPFYRGLYLGERAALGAAASPSAAGERRLGRLRREFPLSSELFAERLAMEGLDEARLLAVLSAPEEVIGARVASPPEWLARLERAYGDGAAPARLADVTPAEDHPMMGLLAVAAPLLADARRRFAEALETIEALPADRPRPFDPRVLLDQLYVPLPAMMLRALSRTLILELHVARLGGALEGSTPEDRYRAFYEGLADPRRALALFAEYPVLGRCLAESAARWHEAMIELAARLTHDFPDIVRALFDGRDPGLCAEVQTFAGDPHRGGRGVMILRFSSGAKLVYKPRSLAADARFQDLLAWLNARGATPALRPLRLLDRGGHGWVEFVHHEPCADRAAAARFFARQGAYLALFHAIEATDLHYENVIACGEHPMPVDLETLFQPRVDLGSGGSELEAAQRMTTSVLRVGLLPNRRLTDDEDTDTSGLLSVSGQLSAQKVPCYTGAGTDQLRVERRRVPIEEGRNLPRIDGPLGETASVLDHEEDLVRGFDSMFRLLVEHREDLLDERGPLAAFADAPIRVILRPTRVYGTLLRESFHPDVLRDAVDRDRLFDRLWETAAVQPALKRVIPAELADLRAGDIPFFTGNPVSRDVIGSRGELIEGILSRPGLPRAGERILAFGDEDRRQQIWFIRASLATAAMGLEDRTRQSPYRFRAGDRQASREDLLAAARAVGERLRALAIAGERDVTWIGLAMNQFKWLLSPLKNELYTGLPGVVLFLAQLGAVTGEAAYTDLAERGYRTFAASIAGGEHGIFAPGLWSGWAGVVYLYTHLAALWDRPALLEEAAIIAERLPPLLEKDTHLDVLYGSAGAIAGLAVAHRARPSARLREIAIQAGERLLAAATPQLGGLGWPILPAGGHALAGFSHGAAGIAWALAHLAELSGQGRFADAAARALDFERAVFSPAHGNWPDLRPPEGLDAVSGGAHFMCAWCHGAAGIGLSRLDLPGFAGDPLVDAEIDVALATTRAVGFGHNHSLCHGDLGNLELLLVAAERRADEALRVDVYRRAQGILDSIAERGWLSGVPLSVETPGLMNGLAGIGYGLLRLAAPARVPSLLLAAPPRQGR